MGRGEWMGRGGWAGAVLDGLEPLHGNTHPPATASQDLVVLVAVTLAIAIVVIVVIPLIHLHLHLVNLALEPRD